MRLVWESDTTDRLDKEYARFGYPSRSSFASAIKEGNVLCNEAHCSPDMVPVVGDVFSYDAYRNRIWEKQDFPMTLLYEDEHLFAVLKPPGVAVHPSPSYQGKTVVQWMQHYYPDIQLVGNPERPGVVHRLDADTTGVLCLAKTQAAWESLTAAFAERSVCKTYIALVHGRFPDGLLRIEAPIGRAPSRVKMGVVSSGKYALSEVRPIGAGDRFSLVSVRIYTGRTHQIRVHLAHIGYPIVGDHLYTKVRSKVSVPRQMLHAFRLILPHPATKKELHLEAPIPVDMQVALQKTGLSDCMKDL